LMRTVLFNVFVMKATKTSTGVDSIIILILMNVILNVQILMLNLIILLHHTTLMENGFVHVKHSMKDLLEKMIFVIEIVLMLCTVYHISWL
jgi:hypothetical protein